MGICCWYSLLGCPEFIRLGVKTLGEARGRGGSSQPGGWIVVSPGDSRGMRQGFPWGALKPRNKLFNKLLKLLTLKRQTQILIQCQPKWGKCKGGLSLFLRLKEEGRPDVQKQKGV